MVDDHDVVGDELTIDWDNLLDNLPDDLDFDLGELPPVDGVSTSPDSGSSFSINDIEHYLLNDEPAGEKDGLGHELVPDVFLDCLSGPESGPSDGSPLSGSDSERLKETPVSPELVDVVTVGEEIQREKSQKSVTDVTQTRENCADDDDVDADDDDVDADDPNAKKRKRQMRNRDAAVRSRERKKMYVRDLEMKSKYYEAECKRLGILLQCCLAENQALRLSFHSSQAFDASRTKQESAVLLLESLLLGSLLGFLGIVYLLILPSQLLSTLEAGLLLREVDSRECKSVAPRTAGSKNLRPLLNSFMMSKRCKASRSKMKFGGLFSTESVS